MMRVGVITTSDKGYRGERDDASGDVIREMIGGLGAEVVFNTVVPDEQEEIKKALIQGADEMGLDIIITTGGTGVSPRDVTPDATREVIEREIPGFAEAMRMAGLKIEAFYESQEDKILLEQFKTKKLILHLELFTELSKALADCNYFELVGGVY